MKKKYLSYRMHGISINASTRSCHATSCTEKSICLSNLHLRPYLYVRIIKPPKPQFYPTVSNTAIDIGYVKFFHAKNK